jgi:hypothetical protein
VIEGGSGQSYQAEKRVAELGARKNIVVDVNTKINPKRTDLIFTSRLIYA